METEMYLQVPNFNNIIGNFKFHVDRLSCSGWTLHEKRYVGKIEMEIRQRANKIIQPKPPTSLSFQEYFIVLFFVPRIFYFFKITAAEIMFPFLTIFLSHILYLMTKMEVSGRVTLKWVVFLICFQCSCSPKSKNVIQKRIRDGGNCHSEKFCEDVRNTSKFNLTPC